ncbi:MAG: Nramp family divalent metal transporter, partial [Bacteroidota bacterium]|nr:Nramp family divalent metal transporter [Bacteroidota bacterium]
MISFIKKLGPGLLFAGAAIGVSHLVQSTKSGAEFGFGLLWALILCNFFKYPFFFFGTKYTHATKETLLDGYLKINKGVLIIYLILSIVTIFTIQAAVTIVTAGLAMELFGITENITYWSIIIVVFSVLLLIIGKYKLLDNLMKFIILILGISTVIALLSASFNSDSILNFRQIIPNDIEGVIFLAAFMGWMPAPLDISIWQSIWTREKMKIDKKIDFNTVKFDFNVGYLTTFFLGLCFVGLGAYVMYQSGEKFSDSGGVFASQLINLYTSNLGENMMIFIAIAAFTTMFSTTITCLDASPRAMSKTLDLLKFNRLNDYNSWIVILSIGTILIFIFFMSEMGGLVKIATVLSFITAPLYAIINYILVSSHLMPKKYRLSKWMKAYSISGIIFLLFF